jgi:hypothetical protein
LNDMEASVARNSGHPHSYSKSVSQVVPAIDSQMSLGLIRHLLATQGASRVLLFILSH